MKYTIKARIINNGTALGNRMTENGKTEELDIATMNIQPINDDGSKITGGGQLTLVSENSEEFAGLKNKRIITITVDTDEVAPSTQKGS